MIVTDFLALSRTEREQLSEPLDFSNQAIGQLAPEEMRDFFAALSQCENVSEINLSNTALSNSFNDLKLALRNWKNLKKIILRRNFLNNNTSELLGEVISQLSTLESLDICNMSDIFYFQFRISPLNRILKNCQQLKELTVDEGTLCDYAGTNPISLSKNCPQLELLVLPAHFDLFVNNRISQSRKLARTLNQCPRLKTIHLLNSSLLCHFVKEWNISILGIYSLSKKRAHQLMADNPNIYEIRGLGPDSEPLTVTQLNLLKNRYIYQMVKKVDEVATTTELPIDLALLIMEYENVLPKPSYFTENQIKQLVKEGFTKLAKFKPALARKKQWDKIKLWASTATSFALTFGLTSVFSLLPAVIFSIASTTLLYRVLNKYMTKRYNALEAACIFNPYQDEDPIQQAKLDEAFQQGKASVNSWSPYLSYYSLKKCQLVTGYDKSWDRGEVAGITEAYNPAIKRAAP